MTAIDGPWFANDRFVSTRDGGSGDIAVVQPDHGDPNKIARRIAATPELLSALQSIAIRLAPGNRTFDEAIRAMDLACDIARAAVAKAVSQ